MEYHSGIRRKEIIFSAIWTTLVGLEKYIVSLLKYCGMIYRHRMKLLSLKHREAFEREAQFYIGMSTVEGNGKIQR